MIHDHELDIDFDNEDYDDVLDFDPELEEDDDLYLERVQAEDAFLEAYVEDALSGGIY
jgi:hypothetical protein